MKYRVLIADDEPRVRKGLQSLIRSREDEWEVCGLVADGTEAIKAATKDRFDIILADVRMPNLDGLQLAHELKAVSPESVVVIMSGYKEFDYARRAMKNGVLDFIVKPIEEEELFAALDRARSEIERRRADRRRALTARDPDAIKDALFAEVMVSSDPVGTGARLCEFLGIELGHFAVVCVLIAPPGPSEDPLPCAREDVEGALHVSPDRETAHVFSFKDQLFVIVMLEKATDGPPASPHPAFDIASALSRIVQGRGRIGGSLPHHGSAEIRAACEESLSALQAGYYGPPGTVFFHVCSAATEISYPAATQQKLAAALVAGDRAAAEACARDFLSPYEQLRAPLAVLDEHMRMVMRHVQESLAPLLPELEDLHNATESFTPVHKYLWFDRLRAEFAGVLGDLSAKVERAYQNRLSRAVRGAVRYIEDNYHRDLPLDEVAKSVALSPSYFSSSFKREMGKNVVEYITEYRVEKAITLLCSTNLNTSEVAYQVGFNDPKYFARVFKRSVGVTPSRYRKYATEK